MAIDQVNLATIERMWRREVEAAHTYKLLAERETDPKRRDILLRLAAQEDKHAARWSERIEAVTGRAPDAREVERGLTWFQRIGDSSVVLHRLEQEETKAEAEYDELMTRLSDPDDRRIVNLPGLRQAGFVLRSQAADLALQPSPIPHHARGAAHLHHGVIPGWHAGVGFIPRWRNISMRPLEDHQRFAAGREIAPLRVGARKVG